MKTHEADACFWRCGARLRACSHVCRVRWRLMLWQQVWHVFQAQTCRQTEGKAVREQIGVRVCLTPRRPLPPRQLRKLFW